MERQREDKSLWDVINKGSTFCRRVRGSTRWRREEKTKEKTKGGKKREKKEKKEKIF